MDIYIEYVLLDNFVVDFVLLLCTNKILKLPTNKCSMVLSALLGALFSLLSPMLNVDGIVVIILKLLVAFIMVFVATFSFYKLFLRFLCFVLLTFMFGGLLIAVCYFMGVSVLTGANLMYFCEIPLASVLAFAFIFLFVVVGVIKKLYSSAKYTKFLYKICLTINNKTKELNAFFDSGNTLKTKDNIPVVILKEDDLKYWFSFDERMQIVMGKTSHTKLKNPQKLDISGVGFKNQILVFDADNLRINNRNFCVAVGIDNSRNFKNFSVLLNNKMGETLC